MEVISKYFDVIKNELNSEKKNVDKIVDLFKTTAELYAHSHINLVNTILYPESTMSVKYPSDWYRPTASFRLTQTFTIQPTDGTIFITFFPNMLCNKSSSYSSLEIINNSKTSHTTVGGRTLQQGMWDSLLSSFVNKGKKQIAEAIYDMYTNKKYQLSEPIQKFIEGIAGTDRNEIVDKIVTELDKLGLNLGGNSNSQSGQQTGQSGQQTGQSGQQTGQSGQQTTNQSSTQATGDRIYVEDGIIEQYRCNAAVISVKGENSNGVLMGTTTYFNTANSLTTQRDKYRLTLNNFAQEWIYKNEPNPENGMRIIKTPKDNSDTTFRNLNQLTPSEQVIMIAGKGLSIDSVILIDVIQHIEFIPTSEAMDFFTPTIPMFSLGSKEQLYKTTSSFPIIGQNGGLIINSPKKLDIIMEYLKKYKEAGYNMTLWNILTDSSYITDKGLLDMISQTFYT